MLHKRNKESGGLQMRDVHFGSSLGVGSANEGDFFMKECYWISVRSDRYTACGAAFSRAISSCLQPVISISIWIGSLWPYHLHQSGIPNTAEIPLAFLAVLLYILVIADGFS